MSDRPEPRALLDIAAEQAEQLESAQATIADLRARLAAAIGIGPKVPDIAEIMLGELYEWIKDNPSVADLLPSGFYARLAAQMSPSITVGKAALDAMDTERTPEGILQDARVPQGMIYTAPSKLAPPSSFTLGNVPRYSNG